MKSIVCIKLLLFIVRGGDLESAFIFEVNRHGARAPFQDNEVALKDFKVQIEQLTAQG